MYVRQVDGEATELGVTGKLWRDSLVFYDRKTRSQWSGIDGRALAGEKLGARMATYPSMVLTWGEWKATFPDTRVFPAPRTDDLRDRVKRRGPYDDYYKKEAQLGVFGTENPDPRLAGKALVHGVAIGDAAKAFPLAALAATATVNDHIGDTPVLVHIHGTPPMAVAFDRRVDGKTLRFEPLTVERGIPLIRDRETESVWLARIGAAVAGPLKGKRLAPVEGRTQYWFIWAAFHPRTAIAGGGGGGDDSEGGVDGTASATDGDPDHR